MVASKFNPPRQFNPTQFYGNLDTMLSASNVLRPSGTVYGFDRNAQTPSLYNYSFGIQRDIGFQTVLDVGYSGNVSRHLMWIRDLNLLPYGTRFLPQNADPTNPSVPLPDNFMRPYPGLWLDSLLRKRRHGELQRSPGCFESPLRPRLPVRRLVHLLQDHELR